jgi:nucleoside-diphosphate-sugar epimerase
MGCIGAWTLYHLVKKGEAVVSFDLQASGHRVDLLLDEDDKRKVTFVAGDLTNAEQVSAVFKAHHITHVVHLAALQVPFCRANPILGAQVNVVGTVNVYEAAKAHGVQHIAQASSVAVYGPPSMYPPGLLAHDAPHAPTTLYGVYKVADEGIARIYWQDAKISSTTLRPYTVYGIGRDQGMTSDPTKAMHAAMAGKAFHINFGGKNQLQFASDVALQFIEAATYPLEGAFALNLGGEPVAISTIVDLIMQNAPGAQITFNEAALALPDGCDNTELRKHYRVYETPIEEGVRQTMHAFGKYLAEGRMN